MVVMPPAAVMSRPPEAATTATFRNLPSAKRERIINAAIDEFSQRNVEEAKLSNIVRQAGIPRGSIYQYFPSKEDLYVYIFESLRGARYEYERPAFELYKTQPFLTFFEEFYYRDSSYLLRHPKHIELGKVMYSHARGVSMGLIRAIQKRYRDTFLVGIDYDKEHGRMRPDLDATALADLCTHFVTDVFIFQNLSEVVSQSGMKRHLIGTLDIIRRGVEV